MILKIERNPEAHPKSSLEGEFVVELFSMMNTYIQTDTSHSTELYWSTNNEVEKQKCFLFLVICDQTRFSISVISIT
jgi:hypothetical protein